MRTQKQTDREDAAIANLLYPNKKSVEFFPKMTHHRLDVDKMSKDIVMFIQEMKDILRMMDLQISDDGTDKFEPVRHLYATDKEEGES